MHGLGNDFVILDARQQPIAIDGTRARAIADRRTGIGCDQLILLEPSDQADLRMRIFNADGGEVEACGNAARCVALLEGGERRIETRGGTITSLANGASATIDMGEPRFGWDEVPLAYAMDTASMPVGWDGLENPASVSMGNPHVVFFVEDVAAVDLGQIGPVIEHDPLFPERVNVSIAQVVSPVLLVARTWERGAGLTLACGTGACAIFAAGRRIGRIEAAKVEIQLPGGVVTIAEGRGGHILMSGPAAHVFSGEIDLEALA